MSRFLTIFSAALLASSAFAADLRYGTPAGCSGDRGNDHWRVITPAALMYEEHEGICALPQDAFSGKPFTANCDFGDESDGWTVTMSIDANAELLIVDKDGWVETFSRCGPTS